jgi:hypothetical protein
MVAEHEITGSTKLEYKYSPGFHSARQVYKQVSLGK